MNLGAQQLEQLIQGLQVVMLAARHLEMSSALNINLNFVFFFVLERKWTIKTLHFQVVSFEEMRNDEGFALHKPLFCTTHPSENLKYFCITCQVLYIFFNSIKKTPRTG